MNIAGTKFEDQRFTTSRDILYSAFYHFSCKPYDVITFVICIMQNVKNKKEESVLFLYFEKPFK